MPKYSHDLALGGTSRGSPRYVLYLFSAVAFSRKRWKKCGQTCVLGSIRLARLECGGYKDVDITMYAPIASFALLAAIIYTRLYREEAFEHSARWRIFDFVERNPGVHYNVIKTNLKLTNGTASHHLRMLELFGYIRPERDGIYLRFYKTGINRDKSSDPCINRRQSAILDAIREKPGRCMSDIARRLGIPVSVVDYNVKNLCHTGTVRLIKGRKARVLCYINRNQ